MRVMKRNFTVGLLTIVLSVSSVAVSRSAHGQTRRSASAAPETAPAPQRADKIVPLPASDAVMFVDMRRLLTEAVPRALEGEPAKLAEVQADLDQFKLRTGIDPRSFDRVALGVRYTNTPSGATKLDHVVAVANGTFNAGSIVALGRIAAGGRYQETKHGGKTVHTFSLNDRIKLLGMFVRISDLSMSVIDANTLVIGEPAGVRAAIDASAGRGRVSAEMLTLAQRNPNAVVGFGSMMPRTLLGKLDGFGSDEVSKNVSAIRQFYGSLGSTATGFDMFVALRTSTPAEAKRLNDTAAALKPIAAFAASQMSGARGRLAQRTLDSLQINMQGNEVLIKLDVAQSDVLTMLQVF